MSKIVRVAAWSGPRNISTAMLRAWENRPDCVVVDEPFYACYLKATGLPHPGAEMIISRQENDWRKVVASLLTELPSGKRVFYQKHMTHHMLPEIDLGWLDQVSHVFLIRDPREMLPSLAKNVPNATIFDTGLPRQVEIFEHARRLMGKPPFVIDSRDALADPRGILTALCGYLGIEFHEGMLHWPAGRRETDGVWAPYWYEAVERSTGFEPYSPKTAPLPENLLSLYDQCRGYYETLREYRVQPATTAS